MGQLTTHVLDTSAGRPAQGILVELYGAPAAHQLLASGRTNQDGRLDSPLLEGDQFEAGEYELLFHAGEYLSSSGQAADENEFLDQVVIRFRVSSPTEHYHVPLLLSPFGYTTYRGS